MDIDEEIPELLPINPTENIEDEIMNFERPEDPEDGCEGEDHEHEEGEDCCGETGCAEGEDCESGCCGGEQDQGPSPLEWRLHVAFSREFFEKDLEKAFRPFLDMQHKEFPTTIFVVGQTSNSKMFDELPLFIGEVEKLQREINISKRKKALKMGKKTAMYLFKFSQLCCFIKIVSPPGEPEAELLDEADIKMFHENIVKCVKKIDKKAQFMVEEDEATAANRALQLTEVMHRCDHKVVVALRSEKGFSGREVYDVLLSLGLRYLPYAKSFGFENELLCLSVSSLGDGHLEPTALAPAGSSVKGFQFNLFIPLCPNPIDVATSMINAAKYAQKRLGGELLDEGMNPLKEEEVLQEVTETVEMMKKSGIAPKSRWLEELW